MSSLTALLLQLLQSLSLFLLLLLPLFLQLPLPLSRLRHVATSTTIALRLSSPIVPCRIDFHLLLLLFHLLVRLAGAQADREAPREAPPQGRGQAGRAHPRAQRFLWHRHEPLQVRQPSGVARQRGWATWLGVTFRPSHRLSCCACVHSPQIFVGRGRRSGGEGVAGRPIQVHVKLHFEVATSHLTAELCG